MGVRGIEKIVLYEIGLVVCRDAQKRQSPSLQGMFPTVIDNISKMFQPGDVKWIYNQSGQETELSFEDWVKKGQEITKSGAKIETKPVNQDQIRYLGTVQNDPQIDPDTNERVRPNSGTSFGADE